MQMAPTGEGNELMAPVPFRKCTMIFNLSDLRVNAHLINSYFLFPECKYAVLLIINI